MNQPIETTKTYIESQKKEFIIGLGVALSVIIVIIAIAVLVHVNAPKVVYQPTKACELLTVKEARELMGNNVLNSSIKNPDISGDTATSNCGYTDGNPDTNNMTVAAIIVRSGINDKGIAQNKTEFTSGKPVKDVEVVQNVGESAYFNKERGQLNVLDGNNWIILSYGPGASPQTNTIENTLKLASKVIVHDPVVSTY